MGTPLFNPVLYDPRWRCAKARKPATDADDLWVTRYRDFLSNVEASVDDNMRMAHQLYITSNFQAGLEGLLTAGADDDFCGGYYNVPSEVVLLYRMVFYDLSPIVGAGARSAIILGPRSETVHTTDGYRYKDIAIRFGLNVLRWKMGEPVKLNEEELDSLFGKVQQGLAMRLQELECTRPTERSYAALLKTVETATKFRQALRGDGDPDDQETFVALLKKNLSSVKEACFDRDKVLASRAVPPKDSNNE